MLVFRRQLRHGRGRHIRRVADDDIVSLASQGLIDIRLNQLDALSQSMPRKIDFRHFQRRGAEIRGIDPRLRKDPRAGNGEAPAASAKIQDVSHLVPLDPGGKLP